jgi:hypothetical protein
MKLSLATIMTWALFASFAQAQAVPFYYGTPTIVEPEIAYVTTGSDITVQRAVVSSDRKYVTLDISAENSNLLGFHTFSFQSGLGFVGSTAAVKGLTAGQNGLTSSLTGPARNSLTPSIAATPIEIAPTPTLLEKPGMTLIAPLPGGK